MEGQLISVPFWAWLAIVGGLGGVFRYQRAKKIKAADLLSYVGLGAILGSSITLAVVSFAEGQAVIVGKAAQVILSLCVGGASVFLFDRGSRLVEWSGEKAAGRAEKKINEKIEGEKP